MVCLGGHSDFAAIHELVGQQARQVRERTAIACRQVRLTYGDVELRANRLAHVLRERGISWFELVADTGKATAISDELIAVTCAAFESAP
jgi:non-ribosomal peptide synthetase component F